MDTKQKLNLYSKARGRLQTGRPTVFKDKTKYDRKRDKKRIRKECATYD